MKLAERPQCVNQRHGTSTGTGRWMVKIERASRRVGSDRAAARGPKGWHEG
jgi:hypothetical protein